MDVTRQLDPEVAAALAALPLASVDLGAIELDTLPQIRQAIAGMPRPPLPPTTTTFTDRTVPGPAGNPDVVVRVYEPAATGAGSGGGRDRPCLFWIHGGGYILGSALMDDARLNRWAEEMGAVIVSVEYRLAPEHPYPAPLDDCYAALTWTYKNAAELGVDAGRIVVAGASAGGGLAAALVLLARDRSEIPIAFQLLIYPMLDDRFATPSSRLDGAPIWSPAANALGWRAYLGHEPGRADVPVHAAPGRAEDLAGLPPGFVCVGTLDVLRDEDIDYARRLLAAGVPTELHVYPGAPHGFEAFAPEADVSRRCQRDIDAALRRALAGDRT